MGCWGEGGDYFWEGAVGWGYHWFAELGSFENCHWEAFVTTRSQDEKSGVSVEISEGIAGKVAGEGNVGREVGNEGGVGGFSSEAEGYVGIATRGLDNQIDAFFAGETSGIGHVITLDRFVIVGSIDRIGDDEKFFGRESGLGEFVALELGDASEAVDAVDVVAADTCETVAGGVCEGFEAGILAIMANAGPFVAVLEA